MTGKELANAVRKHKGKINVPMLTKYDVIYVYAEKKDLIERLEAIGDNPCGLDMRLSDGEAYIDAAD